MSLPVDLRTYLLTITAITDLVGTDIYYNFVDQDAEIPYIGFSRQSTDFTDCLDAAVGEDPFVQNLQFNLVAEDMAQLTLLIDAFKSVVHNYTGSLGTGKVQLMRVITQDDTSIQRITGEDAQVCIADLDIETLGYAS